MIEIKSSITIAVVMSIFGTLFTTAIALLVAWGVRRRSAKESLDKRIIELEQKLALVSASVVPISTAFQAILIKELTHTASPEMDELLDKIGPPYKLTYDEERRLVILLAERAALKGTLLTSRERQAAIIMPYVIMRVNSETMLSIPELTAAAIVAGNVDVKSGTSVAPLTKAEKKKQ